MTQKLSFELLPEAGSNNSNVDKLFVDLKSAIQLAARRIFVIGITAMLVFASVVYLTLQQTPVYKASATVIVDSSQTNVIDLGAVISGTALNTPVIDTEVEVMGSRSLMERVVLKHGLLEDPEFNPFLDKGDEGGGPLDFLRSLFGEETEVEPAPEPTEEEILDSTTTNLLRKVAVARVGTTYLIKATVSSESPDTAANLANAIADQYGLEQLESKLEATERATRWLSERVEILQDEVTEKETLVEQFRSESGLLSAQGTTLTEANIAQLQSQKVQLESDLSLKTARFNGMQRQLQSGVGASALGEVLDSPVVTQLKQQLAEAERKVAELQSRYGPRHPALFAALNEVTDYTRQIDNEMRSIVENLRVEVEVAEDQIRRINSRLSSARSTLVRNNGSQVRLNDLERDAEASRLILTEFIQRFKQTSEQDELVKPDARILSKASAPKSPASPQKLLNFIIGLLLGGFCGVGLALVLEMFDSKIGFIEEIERKFNVNGIASIPFIKTLRILGFGSKNPGEFLVDNPLSAYAESMRFLRASIAISHMEDGTKTVTVASSLPNEGKTSMALSLGRISAMSGDRTLVVDGDFRRRQLTTFARLNPKSGLVEYLTGKCALEDAIYKDKHSDLDLLALSPDVANTHDIVGSRAFDQLLQDLKDRYHLILIDTGPLLLMAEAGIIASKTDKTLMIVRWRHSRRAAVRRALEVLYRMKADILGVALNMVDLTKTRHHSEESVRSKAYNKYYTKEPRWSWSRLKPQKSTFSKTDFSPPEQVREPVDVDH